MQKVVFHMEKGVFHTPSAGYSSSDPAADLGQRISDFTSDVRCVVHFHVSQVQETIH